MKFKFSNILAAILFCGSLLLASINAQISFPKMPKVTPNVKSNVNNKQVNSNGNSPLIYDKTFPPSVIAADLMKSLTINIGGNLVISPFESIFLPDKDASGKDVFYTSDADSHSYTGVLSKNGAKIHDIVFRSTFRPMNRIYWQTEAIGSILKLNGAGNYTMEMFLDGKKFYDFPFEVKESGGNDPYNPNKFLYIANPYQDYGFLSKGLPSEKSISAFSEESSTYWNFWLVNFDGKDRKKVNIKVELFKNGKVVAKNSAAGDLSYVNEKSLENVNIVLASMQNKPFYLKRDLLSSDGNCEIVMVVEGLSLTPTKTIFPFSIKNGQIVPNGKGNRAETNALNFFESGNVMFMIAKKS